MFFQNDRSRTGTSTCFASVCQLVRLPAPSCFRGMSRLESTPSTVYSYSLPHPPPLFLALFSFACTLPVAYYSNGNSLRLPREYQRLFLAARSLTNTLPFTPPSRPSLLRLLLHRHHYRHHHLYRTVLILDRLIAVGHSRIAYVSVYLCPYLYLSTCLSGSSLSSEPSTHLRGAELEELEDKLHRPDGLQGQGLFASDGDNTALMRKSSSRCGSSSRNSRSSDERRVAQNT